MRQEKYIYKVIDKFGHKAASLEETLNSQNTNIELHHIIETDTHFILIWIHQLT